MSDKTSIFNELRIIPKETEYLDKRLGANGEIFFDKGSQSLRIYDGITIGGYAILRADLENIEGQISSVIPSADPPIDVDSGTVWFNTNNGKIYILYNDGNSSQWVQPTSVVYGSGGGSGGSGGSGTVNSGIQNSLAYYSNTGTTVDDLSEITWSANRLNIDGAITANAQKSFLRFHWDTLSDLNSEAPAENWHGMVAHVHETGRLYFAHGGTWIPLANYDELSSASTSFSNISVSGQSTVTADSVSDTLTLVAGPNITIVTNAANDSITISAASSGEGGGGISTGAENRLAYYASTGNIIQDTGSNLTWDGSSLSVNGSMVATSYSGNGALITGVAHSAFTTIAITGQSSIVADSVSDTLTLIAGTGITLTTNANTDSITISSTSSGGGGGASNLNDLTDVVITSPSNGQVLKYNGTSWVNGTDATSGGTTLLDNLGDVSIVGPTIGQVLKYNGTSWVNDADATGSAASNSFQTIAISGQSSVIADSSSDTLNLVGGTGITLTTDASSDTVTITCNVTGGATQFTGLTDVSAASLTVDKIYLPAITRLVVDNNGVTAYTFDQYTGDNPTIYAISGTTIAFDLNAIEGHPFVIQDGSATNYNTGLIHVTATGVVSTGSNAQGKTSGTLYWKIPASISGNYRYQCGAHPAMVGNITVKGFASI